MSARCHRLNVTAHESILLAMYRSLSESRRQDVDGIMWTFWLKDGRVRKPGERRPELAPIRHLTVSHMAPFMAAAELLRKSGSR